MATGLLALLDDVTSLLDDVALLTRVATKKTAGVIGDDLALNAQQVTGMAADRELPVIWAVAKGALLNKAILVPVALAISAWLPQAITPLLMIGGLFLCYEGFEKVWEKLFHRHAGHDPQAPADVAGAAHRVVDRAAGTAGAAGAAAAGAEPVVDVAAFEKQRVRGAIRTDFILSAEIIVIALGEMTAAPLGQRIAALTAVGIGVTVLVYGLVAGIVKLDDLGLRLIRTGGEGSGQARLGSAILRGTPWLMKGLSILGTAAMFLVGGQILAHGLPFIEHLVHDLPGALKLLADAAVGIVAGGLVVGVLHAGKALRGKQAAHA